MCDICHEISGLINEGGFLNQTIYYLLFLKNFVVRFLVLGKYVLPPFCIIELK